MTLLSVTERNRSLDLFYGTSKGSGASASHELALYVGDPANGGTELGSDGGYARVTVSNDATSWPDAAASGAKTSAVLTFAVSTGAWSGTATHWALVTSGGDIADCGPLTDPVTVADSGVAVSVQVTVYYSTGA